jgi:hypothetical protein
MRQVVPEGAEAAVHMRRLSAGVAVVARQLGAAIEAGGRVTLIAARQPLCRFVDCPCRVAHDPAPRPLWSPTA